MKNAYSYFLGHVRYVHYNSNPPRRVPIQSADFTSHPPLIG